MISAVFLEKLKRQLTARGLKDPRFAVVLPLVFDAGKPDLLIEVRQEGISQAGDPCFPGGKIEEGETPLQAAAREFEEELGIRAEPDAFLGRLPTVKTRLGSNTDVFVCTVSSKDADRASPNPSEVAALLRVPLSFFLAQPELEAYTFRGHTIWGMTAGAIRHFCAAWKRAEEEL